MEIRVLAPGDEALLIVALDHLADGELVSAMALYASAGGVRPNPDDVMFDFEG
ncbi:hypothetical protein BH10PSE5_BH10PSE5_20480 [soil metagenome]